MVRHISEEVNQLSGPVNLCSLMLSIAALAMELMIWLTCDVCVCVTHSVVSDSLRPRGLYLTRFLHPRDFPGKNTGVGCHFFLQGIFPTQGLNPGLPHCRWILYHLSQVSQTQAKPGCCPSSLHSDPSVPHSLKRPDQAPVILAEPLRVGGGAHRTTLINPPLYIQKLEK